MNAPAQIAKLTGLRRTPGLAEIESLLELLPNASLLVERRTKRILLANTLANELTAHTRAELAGMRLATLIDNLDETVFWDSPAAIPLSEPLTLRKRNGIRTEVQVARLDLSPHAKWSVVTLEEMQLIQQRQTQQQRRTERLLSMQTLSKALSQPDLDSALRLVLQAGSQIIGANILSVYLQNLAPENQNVELVRYAHFGTDNTLPERLPGQELMLLRATQFWTPGKRSATSLHRAARTEKLSFLASTPLGNPNAVIGFVAIAGNYSLEPEKTLAQLQTLADVITALIQFHTRALNLENSLDIQQRARVVDKTGIDAVDDGIIVLSPTLSISRLNPAAETILGYTNQEANGHAVDDILIGTSTLTPVLQVALQGIPTLKQESIRLYRRSGQPFLAEVSIIPAMIQDQLEGIVILIRDLSEQEQIQAQAQHLEQRALLGELSAVFAHEVRNPVNNISTGLQFMAYDLPADDPHQKVIALLQQDFDRINSLMNSVLAFSRPTDYAMEPVDLGILISRLMDRLKPRMVQANVQQFLQIEPSLPLVNGNPRALEQVFSNLTINAIQAMSEKGGTLALKIQKVEGPGNRNYVEVHVADNGPGISKEHQEHLFQLFFTTKVDGTGMGLPITKRILTAHKGTIQVTSYPGATVFHVQIPVQETP